MADPITLAALHAFVNLSDPRLSPDGTRIAYVRTVRDYVHDRNVASIVVVRTDGTGRRTIDAGPFVDAPRWSPDGTHLAYKRHTPKDDADQLVVARIADGSERVVTHAPNGVEHYAWSPDGQRFVYDTPDDEPNAAAAKAHDDLFEVGDDGFLTDKPPVPSHFWLVASSGAATALRLTHGTWSVFEQSAPFSGGGSAPSWSRDGRTIVFTRNATAHTAATDRSSIATVDVATGAVHELGTIRQYAYLPTFAPSGNRYAYIRPHGPGPVSTSDIVVGDARGETDRTASLDRDVSAVLWRGSSIVALVQNHVLGSIALVPPTGAPRVLDLGRLSVESVDATATMRLAYVASSYGVPPEIYTSLPGTKPRAVTNENAALRRYDYGRAERVQWTAADGEVSEGVVIHPPHERPNVKYPLLLWLHGGPEGESAGLGFGQEYPGGYDAGIMAAANGWYAFFPNYRGSNDEGSAHEHGVYRDPGEGPMRDVMAGLAAVETRFPAIDTKHESVGGHSYGGYMTAWIIGHTTRFRSAIVADGANLSWTRDSFGGTPASTPQLYRDGSPITYANAVRTPTLIITGLADEVVPFSESWSYYHALRDRGVPVHLVAIPTAHHTPSDPVRLEAYYRRMSAWLAEHR
jgi:dipeptidyl aminopeptidase/acylaminoacyl peptidase